MEIHKRIIDESMKFYRNYDTRPHMRSYATMLALENNLNISYKEVDEWFKDDYTAHMKEYFHSRILFAEEVSSFAFDKFGNLLPLDNIIYQKLCLYATKCRILDFEEKIHLYQIGPLKGI